MKVSSLKVIYVIVIIVIIAGCKGGEIYPIIPSIEYESSYVIRNSSTGDVENIGLVIKYRDGDGDLGLQQSDTLPPFNFVADSINSDRNINYFYNNLHVEYLEKNGDTYTHAIAPFTTDTLKKMFRVMVLTPEGKFKAIRGTIEVKFEPSIFPNRADTVKFRVKLI